jgi:hypothetical protein
MRLYEKTFLSVGVKSETEDLQVMVLGSPYLYPFLESLWIEVITIFNANMIFA